MTRAILSLLAAGGIVGILAVSTEPSFAKTVAECDAQYTANKDAIKASGQTKKDYVAACRAGTVAAPVAAPAAAAAAPASAPAAVGSKTVKECDEEYAANKDAIKASKQTKKDFVAACRVGTAVIPAAAAPVAPAAAPPPTPAAPSTVAPAPASVAPKPHVGAAGAGGFSSDTQAKARCPTDTVVWVNTKSRIYHFPGTHEYGSTKQGTYMCEADAKAAGDRAAKNEQHP